MVRSFPARSRGNLGTESEGSVLSRRRTGHRRTTRAAAPARPVPAVGLQTISWNRRRQHAGCPALATLFGKQRMKRTVACASPQSLTVVSREPAMPLCEVFLLFGLGRVSKSTLNALERWLNILAYGMGCQMNCTGSGQPYSSSFSPPPWNADPDGGLPHSFWDTKFPPSPPFGTGRKWFPSIFRPHGALSVFVFPQSGFWLRSWC